MRTGLVQPTRRGVLAGLSLLGAGALPFAAKADGLRIVCMDYALGETMLALGLAPVGLASAADWKTWVVEPPLPAETRDVGTGQLPNLELIARMKPDLILTTPYLDPVEAALRRVGPVLRVPIYEDGRRPFEGAVAATTILGERLGRENEARRFLTEADEEFRLLGERAAGAKERPLLLVNLMDGRHFRVHGGNGLFQGVLDHLGLANAYRGEATYWGFQTIGVERLAPMGEARLVSIEPVPPDVEAILAASPLWRELPFVKAGRVSTVPSVNAFGAVPSALRLARFLAAIEA